MGVCHGQQLEKILGLLDGGEWAEIEAGRLECPVKLQQTAVNCIVYTITGSWCFEAQVAMVVV